MSQSSDLLAYLKSHGSITRLEAFRDLGIAELSARIIDIEHQGYLVPRERVTVKSRNGRKCRVVKYLTPTEDLFA